MSRGPDPGYNERMKIGRNLHLIVAWAVAGLAVGGLVFEILHGKAGLPAAASPFAAAGSAPVPYDPGLENADGFWRLGTPDAEGLVADGVKAYLELCRLTGADAALVVKRDAIVGEWYSARYRPPTHAMSSTKSVTGLLVGILQDEGLLRISDRVGDHLPAWKEGIRGKVTIKHLLTQTSGLLQQSDPARSVGTTEEKNAFVMALTPQAEPGTRFSYSNEGVQLLSPLMEAAAGMRLDEYARKRLFEPLGMAASRLWVSGKNRDVWTYADMLTTPRDFARLGILMLDNGLWRGRRIVSEAFLREAVSPSGHAKNYGYLWWILVGLGGGDAVAARGYLNTDLYVLPRHQLVVVRMQAPRTVHTGAAESDPYDDFVATALGAAVGTVPLADAKAALQKAAARTGAGSGGPSPSVPAAGGSGKPAEVLDRAVILSQAGDTRGVLAMLLPIADAAEVDEASRARAWATIALQYLRERDRKAAEAALDRARALGIESQGGWWVEGYRETRSAVSGLK